MILRRMTRWWETSGRQGLEGVGRSQTGQGKHPRSGGIPTNVGQTPNEGRHTSNWVTELPLRDRVELIATKYRYMRYKICIENNSICNMRYSKYLVLIINVIIKTSKTWDTTRVKTSTPRPMRVESAANDSLVEIRTGRSGSGTQRGPWKHNGHPRVRDIYAREEYAILMRELVDGTRLNGSQYELTEGDKDERSHEQDTRHGWKE